MDKNCAGISILNGEVRAAAYVAKSGAAGWQSPAGAEDLPSVIATLNGALHSVRPNRRTVSIVLAHPKLSDQVIEVPPVKGWKLDQVLQRIVESSKSFSEVAVWSRQPGLATKTGNSVLVHFCPQTVIEQLNETCRTAELQLLRVIPTTTVLIGHLKLLPLEKDELAVLAAETGAFTTVVIGRSDGLVCLGRVLRSSWKTESDRVNIDLTRSIGFAEQQTGLAVASVWLFGAGAEAQVPLMRSMLQLPVSVSPVPFSPNYWAEQAAQFSGESDGNLLSVESRHAAQRHRFLTLTGVFLGLLLLSALLTAAIVERLCRRTLKASAFISDQIAGLRMQKADLEQVALSAAQTEQIARIAHGHRLSPTPAWFLGYLSEVVSSDLVLTELQVRRTNNLWAVRVTGAPKSTLTEPAALEQAFARLTNSLVNGPFHLTIDASPIGKIDDPELDELSGDPVLIRHHPDHSHFLVEGWIR